MIRMKHALSILLSLVMFHSACPAESPYRLDWTNDTILMLSGSLLFSTGAYLKMTGTHHLICYYFW